MRSSCSDTQTGLRSPGSAPFPFCCPVPSTESPLSACKALCCARQNGQRDPLSLLLLPFSGEVQSSCCLLNRGWCSEGQAGARAIACGLRQQVFYLTALFLEEWRGFQALAPPGLRAQCGRSCSSLSTESPFGVCPRRYHLPNGTHSCLDSIKHTCNLCSLHGRCTCGHHLNLV